MHSDVAFSSPHASSSLLQHFVSRSLISLCLSSHAVGHDSIHTTVAGFVGKSSASVVSGALDYSRIRAWGTPATLLFNVGQAACFGDKDPDTPLRGVWIAGALNLVGDLLLVPCLGMGVKGAAIATVAAQYAGCLPPCLTLQVVTS